jgi:hypothetical protein
MENLFPYFQAVAVMNWGELGGWAGAALCVLSSIGYACAGDIRRCLYYLFAFAITLVVIWR